MCVFEHVSYFVCFGASLGQSHVETFALHRSSWNTLQCSTALKWKCAPKYVCVTPFQAIVLVHTHIHIYLSSGWHTMPLTQTVISSLCDSSLHVKMREISLGHFSISPRLTLWGHKRWNFSVRISEYFYERARGGGSFDSAERQSLKREEKKAEGKNESWLKEASLPRRFIVSLHLNSARNEWHSQSQKATAVSPLRVDQWHLEKSL